MKTHSRFGNTIVGNIIQDITYTALALKITNSELRPGERFKITDYRTVHTIPNTVDTNTGTLEPLIVTALSVNDLEPVAYSTTFPDDIVYYDYVNNSKVNGSTKGCIYRRIDTVNNSDIPFDWREVKFRRWQIDVDTVFDIGDTYANGDVVLDADNTTIWISLIDGNIGNTPTDTDEFWRKFEWSNLAYVSYSSVSMILCGGAAQFTIPVTANYQDIKSFTSAINTKMHYDRFALLDILESNNSYFGSIEDSIISVSYSMKNNHINGITGSNISTSYFEGNSIGYFAANIIKGSFKGNSINYFLANSSFVQIDGNSLRSCIYNVVNKNFTNNRMGFDNNGGLYHNIFNSFLFTGNHLDKTGGEFFRYNSFNDGITVSGISFLPATHVFGAYTTQTIQRSNNTLRLSYVDGTDTIIYAAVNA